MSHLEWAMVALAASLWLILNLCASVRALRNLGRYSLGYLLIVWVLPIFGALTVWARLGAPRKSYLPADDSPLPAQGPATLQDCATLTNIKPLRKEG